MTPNKIEEFKTALTNNDWTKLNVATDVNAAYELFLNRFLKIYDDKWLITIKRTKPYSKHHKPWATSAILKSIHHKHSLYKKVYKIKLLNPSWNIQINWQQLSVLLKKITIPKNLKWAKEILEKLG